MRAFARTSQPSYEELIRRFILGTNGIDVNDTGTLRCITDAILEDMRNSFRGDPPMSEREIRQILIKAPRS